MSSLQTSLAIARPGLLAPWRVLIWASLLTAAVAMAWWDHRSGWLAGPSALPYATMLLLLLALCCEFVDATIGMGYGTALTPALLILGYPVHVIVPAVVLSQIAGNCAAGFFHHRVGNTDFLRDQRVLLSALLLGGVGLAMSVVAVLIATRSSPRFASAAVAVIVLTVGVFLLLGSRFQLRFSWRKLTILGAVAAFNKAFTGGGYGPLVCGGQIINGTKVKSAVAASTIASAIVCVSAVVAYLVSGTAIELSVLGPLTVGAVLSTPVGAMALRGLPEPRVRRVMSVVVIILGLLALLKVVG